MNRLGAWGRWKGGFGSSDEFTPYRKREGKRVRGSSDCRNNGRCATELKKVSLTEGAICPCVYRKAAEQPLSLWKLSQTVVTRYAKRHGTIVEGKGFKNYRRKRADTGGAPMVLNRFQNAPTH